MNSTSVIHVVAAVITDTEGRVLLSRRPEHLHLGGLWEFPGGKVESAEPPLVALRRELYEELGIEQVNARPLIQVPYVYPEKSVVLDVWWVSAYGGAPMGREGQALAWVAPEELSEWNLPPADEPIVTAIGLPEHYLITPEPGLHWSKFLHQLCRALEGGIRLVQLRSKRLTDVQYRELAREALALCRERGAALLLNHTAELVVELGADGVHLPSKRLREFNERPLPETFRVAASCHDLDELERAVQLGVDFAVLGPVARTSSHPNAIPMGWDRFRACVNAVALPVYALGGMRLDDVVRSQDNGGQGIAAITGLWVPSNH